MAQSGEFLTHGKSTEPAQNIHTVIRHDYLRKSMVDRIERKSLLKQYRQNVAL